VPSLEARLGALGLLALAWLSGDRVWLRLLPALAYLALAQALLRSLRGPGSLFETLVRRWLPAAPEFIGPYCRALTALWAGVFAACAAVVAGTALFASPGTWLAWTAWRLFAGMAALALAEFLVRKTWFRYYFRGGPFDRLWSRLFPAEATARGRRSLEAIRRYRAGNG
jgi:uncharacterized membrane protein